MEKHNNSATKTLNSIDSKTGDRWCTMILPSIKKGNWGEKRSPKRKRGKLDSNPMQSSKKRQHKEDTVEAKDSSEER
jgi:hypothetical protein